MRFRRTPLLFEVGAVFAGGSVPTPAPIDVIAAVLWQRRVRLTAPSMWDRLVISFEPSAAKRRVSRSRAMGWITCTEPLRVVPQEVTVSALSSLADATSNATAEVASQLEPDDILTAEALNAHVARALAGIPTHTDELESFLARLARDRVDLAVRRLAEDDAVTAPYPRPATTLIRGMRGYGHYPGFPYNFQGDIAAFADVLGGRMRGERLRLPGYHTVDLHVAPTIDEAIGGGGEPSLSECRNAYAVVDLDAYTASSPERRFQLLVAAAETGLERLVRVDHLEAPAVATCLAAVVALGAERTFARDVPGPAKR